VEGLAHGAHRLIRLRGRADAALRGLASLLGDLCSKCRVLRRLLDRARDRRGGVPGIFDHLDLTLSALRDVVDRACDLPGRPSGLFRGRCHLLR
jgi:hypothetical protein